MIILGIDPGPEESAMVALDAPHMDIYWAVHKPNAEVRGLLVELVPSPDVVVVEWIGNYGIAVGASVFDTCRWVGRFEERVRPRKFVLLQRPTIKARLCGTVRAKDSNVRQALIDRFPPTSKGSVPQIGTKKFPGPLYAITKHCWAALAVAVAWWEIQQETKP